MSFARHKGSDTTAGSAIASALPSKLAKLAIAEASPAASTATATVATLGRVWTATLVLVAGCLGADPQLSTESQEMVLEGCVVDGVTVRCVYDTKSRDAGLGGTTYGGDAGYAAVDAPIDAPIDAAIDAPTDAAPDEFQGMRGTMFDAIVTAKGTDAQRLHSKYVAVDLDDRGQSAASVGSLNLYNARFMHDYGNIIVGGRDNYQLAVLRQQFETQFESAPNTVAANARAQRECDPSRTGDYVVADLTDPGTPFGSQVDLTRDLTWHDLDVATQPGLQIEQFGREALARVAVHIDCSGDVVLSTVHGPDGWNYLRDAMTSARASMPQPPPGTRCHLRVVTYDSDMSALLTCGPQTISVPIQSLAAASAYYVTPDTAVGRITYFTGTCNHVASQ